jgi:CheY-like chemotaxis protein
MAESRILLIDDELEFLEVMGSRIKSWGYDLIAATNGKEAIDAVENKNPDIVVLDYKLPDMDGVEVLKEIRKINKEIPVIMFTAYADEKSMKGTEELGAYALIPKLSVYQDAQATLKSVINTIEKKLGKKE